MNFKPLVIIALLVSSFATSQTPDAYISALVPQELKEHANAVVRYDNKHILIEDYDKIITTKKRIVTIYNKYGIKHANAMAFYDNNTSVKKIEAKIFDAWGKEIKKIKKNDFSDQSAVSGGALYTDDRIKFYDYTPVKYPYTIEFVSVVEQSNTAFIPQWMPIDGYYLGVQYSEYKIENNSGEGLNAKPYNFEGYTIEKLGEHHFKAENLSAVKYEDYSPSISSYVPRLKTTLTRFNMDGVEGNNTNWKDFGKWMYNRLLVGTDAIPKETIDEVVELTKNEPDKIERAKMVYKYMQDRTRYISVQIGIGGWKPMLAKDVDKLGYGDCKGLTNYTKALLEAVDVPSYYVLVYGGENIRDIDSTFSSAQGNHAILCVPNADENIFLECTSQDNPFSFTSGFTDDRDVLLVKPEGGEIVHTKVYSAEESLQKTTAEVHLDALGNFTAEVAIMTKGYQYNNHEGVQNQNPRDQKLHYKEYWDNVNALSINDIKLENDKAAIVFKEYVKVSTQNYASKSGNRLIVQPNIFNKITGVPSRYIERKLDFKIDRAFKDVDEFIINYPENLKVEAMSEGATVTTKFGTYTYKLEALEGNKLKYTRTYILNNGAYEKEDYKAFRAFSKQIVKNDKTKIVFVKS